MSFCLSVHIFFLSSHLRPLLFNLFLSSFLPCFASLTSSPLYTYLKLTLLLFSSLTLSHSSIHPFQLSPLPISSFFLPLPLHFHYYQIIHCGNTQNSRLGVPVPKKGYLQSNLGETRAAATRRRGLENGINCTYGHLTPPPHVPAFLPYGHLEDKQDVITAT